MCRELPKSLEDFAKSEVEAGRFASLESAVDDLIDAGMAQLEVDANQDQRIARALEGVAGSRLSEFDLEEHLRECAAEAEAERRSRD